MTHLAKISEQTRNQLTEEIVEIRQMNEQLAEDVKNVRAQLKNSDEQNLIDNLERRWSNTQQNNQVQNFIRCLQRCLNKFVFLLKS